MKIKINNFGPISELIFDLDKDLHLVFGENAIGKSYGAYCVYCLLKNFKSINTEILHPYYHFNNEDTEIHRFAKVVYSNIKNSKKNKPFSLDDIINSFIIGQLTQSILPSVKNSFQNTFSTLENLRNRYSNKGYTLEFFIRKKRITIGSDKKGNPIISNIFLGFSTEGLLKDTKTTKYSIYINNRKRFGVGSEKKFINDFIYFIIKEVQDIYSQLSNNIKDIYFLPASRSGLYQALNAFTPIMAELSQNRFFIQNKNIELPSLPEPLSDYFIDLATLDKKHINNEFNDIINIIEEEILNGRVEYNDNTKKIIYIPKGLDLKLDLSEASSMVSELSPIVVFLRHIINNKFQPTKDPHYFYQLHYRQNRKKTHSIIFIEEPEAHLHPNVQVKIMNVFTKLVDLGIKVIMTSHSNYMFNKLNNLILDNKIKNNKIEVYHLIKSKTGCIVNKEMSISSQGIFDDNFTEITKELYMERMEILEKNNNANTKN